VRRGAIMKARDVAGEGVFLADTQALRDEEE
jgi:hypothetical protein